jgi:hypothetical protein
MIQTALKVYELTVEELQLSDTYEGTPIAGFRSH